MDPITHCLVGGTVAKTLKSHRRRFWIMIFLGEAPDLDVFTSHLGASAFWLQHRSVTHSFFGVAVQALFYAAVFSKLDPDSFFRRARLYVIPLLLHICCDYLTSYGTPLLAPFSFHEFVGNLMPAVTVIPIAFMAIGLYWSHRKMSEGWSAMKPLWFAWIFYLAFALGDRAYAAHQLQHESGKITVVSGLFNPVGWTAVVESAPFTYQGYRINGLTGEIQQKVSVATPVQEFPIIASLTSASTERIIRSTRWPVGRAEPKADGGWRVDWGKMLFSSRGVVRSLWTVDVSSAGVISHEQKSYGFWNPNENKS